MEQQTFSSLFKDLISRLYDRVTIQTHPLAPFFPVPETASTRRAEVIQQLIQDEIEQLRPEGKEVLLQSPEWRPYLILQKRYIEGQDPHEIAQSLFIGDRQFRRDHSRALQALSQRVWQRYFQPAGQPSGAESTDLFDDQSLYEYHAEQLDLNEVLQGVVNLIAPRLKLENIQLEMTLSPAPMHVFTDRILLRQILLSLLNYVLHLRGKPGLTLQTESNRNMCICIRFDADEQWVSIQNDERDSLEFARRLSERLPARLEELYPAQDTSGTAEIRLVFTISRPRMVLVLDDQVAAQRMYQRYLSRTNLEVIGVTDPTQGVDMIRKIQPSLLILDVMMPHIDGWEVLQNLQLDPETKHIPIIVCSAWGEPELARSLGAVAFLKKPVIQKDLLDLLVRLGLISE
ncbi:MAG TPA: response regulator [Anaerolineales bacterium]|nr:response regulator [Anaerolineales bacterium]